VREGVGEGERFVLSHLVIHLFKGFIDTLSRTSSIISYVSYFVIAECRVRSVESRSPRDERRETTVAPRRPMVVESAAKEPSLQPGSPRCIITRCQPLAVGNVTNATTMTRVRRFSSFLRERAYFCVV